MKYQNNHLKKNFFFVEISGLLDDFTMVRFFGASTGAVFRPEVMLESTYQVDYQKGQSRGK